MGARGGKAGAAEFGDDLVFAVALQADAGAQLPVIRQRGESARSARPSGSRASRRIAAAPARLAMPTSGRRMSPSTKPAARFQQPPDHREGESSSSDVMYCATEFITTRSIDFASILRRSSSERTRILVFGAKRAISRPRTPGAGWRDRAWRRRRPPWPPTALRRRHSPARRHQGGDVADDVARDDLEMQVAMQLARIDRMRGIVIVDPFVHGASSGKTGFRHGNRPGSDALAGSTTNVHCRRVRFLTGRCNVSKANNKPDKDLPRSRYPDRSAAGRRGQDLGALNVLLADAFALYMKTKNFHWHVSGPAFPRLSSDARRAVGRDLRHHRPIAERVRKLGGATLHSIGADRQAADHPGQQRGLRAAARDAARADGGQQAHRRRHAQSAQALRRHEDFGTASLLELYIDETERRTWFLFEASRQEEEKGGAKGSITSVCCLLP